jgi:hypothetical protein
MVAVGRGSVPVRELPYSWNGPVEDETANYIGDPAAIELGTAPAAGCGLGDPGEASGRLTILGIDITGIGVGIVLVLGLGV